MTATGCGALLGALWLASRRRSSGSPASFRSPPTCSVRSDRILVRPRSCGSPPCLIVAGFGFMVQMALEQHGDADDRGRQKRGRVDELLHDGVPRHGPRFGSLLAGSLSSRIGAPHTLLRGGACCILAALWFARALPELRSAIRPIYVRLGQSARNGRRLANAADLSVPARTGPPRSPCPLAHMADAPRKQRPR